MLDGATPRPPGIVATDLDGTLLRSDGSLSERTRSALLVAEAAGITIVFVTARPPRWLDELADAVGAHGIALCGNGAFVYDVPTRTVTEQYLFESRVADELAADLRSAIPTIRFAAEGHDGPRFESGFAYRREAPDPSHLASLDDIIGSGIGKFLARCADLAPADFLAKVADVIDGRAELGISEGTGLAEMTAVGVTKAAGLERWCFGHDIAAADVWAFGDMPNDLPMLRWAGTSFAVGNAHTEVVAAADHIIASNDEDGVATMLEQLVAAPMPFRLDDNGVTANRHALLEGETCSE